MDTQTDMQRQPDTDTHTHARSKSTPPRPPATSTHQPDKLAVQPAQDVGPLLSLCPVHGQASHQDGRGLLVEGGSDALDLCLCVGPA